MNKIESLVPIIILKSYNDTGKWVGPIDDLQYEKFSLTWVYMNTGNSMTYLTHDDEKKYIEEGVNFREVAITNLEGISENIITGIHKNDKDEVLYCTMMHDDGLGSSRLLLFSYYDYEFAEEYFNNEYLVAMPDRSVAIILSKNTTKEEKKEITELVKSCYSGATTPMSDDIFEIENIYI